MSSRVRYAKISLEKRLRLIQMISEEGISINKAGKKLGLKPSTAKLIAKKYRQTGTFASRNRQRVDEHVPDHELVLRHPASSQNMQEIVHPHQHQNHQNYQPYLPFFPLWNWPFGIYLPQIDPPAHSFNFNILPF